MRQFANQYGLLGLAGESEGAVMVVLKSDPWASVGRMPAWADGNRNGALRTGELLPAWQRQLQDIRQTVDLWPAVGEAESGDVVGGLTASSGVSKDDLIRTQQQALTLSKCLASDDPRLT